MIETNTPTPPPVPAADDSYWNALFAEEAQQSFQAMPVEDGFPVDDAWPFADNAQAADWQTAQSHHDEATIINVVVSGYNRGGLLVQWNSLSGFIPSSHLISFPLLNDDAAKLDALSRWVDKELSVKIIRIDPSTNHFILSERASRHNDKHAVHLLETLQAGDIIDGTVTNITNFGVFVDLGGIEGLVHISELSWSRVRHPNHIVQIGELLTVKVLRVEREHERIALSLKQLKQDPWQTAEAHYQPDQMVTGTITHITNYGAFVLLEDELEGLIHLSELAEGSFMHPRNVVSVGETVTARVMTVDGKAKRLALSLRPKIIDNG